MLNLLTRKLENFVSLDRDDRALLDRVIESPRQVPAGVEVISEGDKPTDVHLVLDGFACRYKVLPDGGRQIMAYLVPGDICDLHVFLLDQMDHSMSTLSACTIVDIPRATVLALLERPRIAQGFLLSTLVDEGTLREWLVNVGRRSADDRVAHLLCELLARLESVGLVQNDSYRLPITQVELADTTGLSSVHVNRVLQRLRASKLITLQGSQLVVLDVKGLRELAGWNANYLHLRKMPPTATS